MLFERIRNFFEVFILLGADFPTLDRTGSELLDGCKPKEKRRVFVAIGPLTKDKGTLTIEYGEHQSIGNSRQAVPRKILILLQEAVQFQHQGAVCLGEGLPHC